MFASVAIAQQSHSDSGQLEEIIVTAEKRESTVQSTPMSLTAVSGQDIQNRGLTNLSLIHIFGARERGGAMRLGAVRRPGGRPS